jgi:hypothetical protein
MTKSDHTTKPRLTPWQRIAQAAKRGTGLRLSADEVFRLSMDDAIMRRAALDDLGIDHEEELIDE